jgi:hypothetical protein
MQMERKSKEKFNIDIFLNIFLKGASEPGVLLSSKKGGYDERLCLGLMPFVARIQNLQEVIIVLCICTTLNLLEHVWFM